MDLDRFMLRYLWIYKVNLFLVEFMNFNQSSLWWNLLVFLNIFFFIFLNLIFILIPSLFLINIIFFIICYSIFCYIKFFIMLLLRIILNLHKKCLMKMDQNHLFDCNHLYDIWLIGDQPYKAFIINSSKYYFFRYFNLVNILEEFHHVLLSNFLNISIKVYRSV
jgi:hypothetical protein